MRNNRLWIVPYNGGIKGLYIVLSLVYAFFFYLMLRITLQYIPLQNDAAFLNIKQQYIHLTHYRLAFFVHVFSAIFVLLAGFTQFSSRLRTKAPLLHRRMGWLYVVLTVLVAGPSGFVIGIYANGGISSQLAFCILSLLWMFFTVMAVIRIKKRDISGHRAWMLRSFALALSAITLRAWKYVLVALFHPHPMDVYRVVAWLGWTLNLMVAELLIFNFKKNENKHLV